MKKRILSLLFAILMICAVLPAVASAETASGSCGDDLNWSLDNEGVLTIIGSGDMNDYGWTEIELESGETVTGFVSAPWNAWIDSIKSVIIGNGVTSIGGYTFSGCENLSDVSLGNSIKKIGMYAFQGCSLTSIDLPDTIKTIGSSAFSSCGLTSVTIPAGIEEMQYCSFSTVKNAVFEGDAPSYFEWAFSDSDDVTIFAPIGNKTWIESGAYDAELQTWHYYPIEFYAPHVHSYTAAVTSPTCTTQGYTTYTCECGDSYEGDYISPLGHNYSKNGVCTHCGEKNPDFKQPSFFSSLLDSIRNVFKSMFSWLPFC